MKHPRDWVENWSLRCTMLSLHFWAIVLVIIYFAVK
jgi:hypothetical protein